MRSPARASSRSATPGCGRSTSRWARPPCGSSVASRACRSRRPLRRARPPPEVVGVALTAVPLLFVLVGLTCYIVLAGADFGAAIWQITAPQTPEGRRIRDFAHNVMAPVWEANHVWLIFVLTVTWTAYPAAFGSIASTLSIALIVAALGIVIRGAAYAVSAGTSGPRQVRDVDVVSALSSIVTPFALGACVGGIASGRVPYGKTQGDLGSSWLNPTSAVIGALAIAISAYLAAVYLCDDAQRRGEDDLVAAYRRRALGAGTVARLLAGAGLGVLGTSGPRTE